MLITNFERFVLVNIQMRTKIKILMGVNPVGDIAFEVAQLRLNKVGQVKAKVRGAGIVESPEVGMASDIQDRGIATVGHCRCNMWGSYE